MSDAIVHIPRGPEFRARPAFSVAGLSLLVNETTRSRIPQLWQRFAGLMAEVPGRVGDATFGVCNGMNHQTGEFTYYAAVETSQPQLCGEFELCEVPAAEYAVFTHEGSLAHILDTVGYIFGSWLPESGYETTGTPDFELYDGRFDPQKDCGEFEYWIPVTRTGS